MKSGPHCEVYHMKLDIKNLREFLTNYQIQDIKDI